MEGPYGFGTLFFGFFIILLVILLLNADGHERQLYNRWERCMPAKFDQLEQGAYNWDCIARASGISYCFVGFFGGLVDAPVDSFSGFELEILLEPTILATNARILKELFETHENDIGTTSEDHDLVRIDTRNNPRLGVVARTFVPTDDTFQDIGPWLPPGTISEQQPTYQFIKLRGSHSKYVPVLRSDLLIRQRLREFERDLMDENVDKQRGLKNNIPAIRQFLRRAGSSNPLPPGLHDMSDIVKRWVKFASETGAVMSFEERGWWARLGVEITDEDIEV